MHNDWDRLLLTLTRMETHTPSPLQGQRYIRWALDLYLLGRVEVARNAYLSATPGQYLPTGGTKSWCTCACT